MLWVLLLFVNLVHGSPVTKLKLGITYKGVISNSPLLTVLDVDNLPLLTLPYATYQAKSYDIDNDIYIFENIRFAAPPVGNLRWQPPAEPLSESGIQDGSIGGSCFQSTPLEVSLLFDVLKL